MFFLQYSLENTCVEVFFLIKNFKETLLKLDPNTGVSLWILQNFIIFKITCFEGHLLTTAFIKC